MYGYAKMLGFRTHDGKLEIVPEEAEIVRRIFHSYVYEGKGCHTIANELNASGLLTVRGKMWREDGVCRILKNDKYVGDLTQWKHYSTDFLTKRVLQNNGDNPDTPLITIKDHHEGIIPRDVWNLVQNQIYERGRLSKEGRKYSHHYWYSSKVSCGCCGYSYNVFGRYNNPHKTLRCVNRGKYGTNHRIDKNGAEVGCDNSGINVIVLEEGMRYIIEQIKQSEESIVEQLLDDIKLIQQNETNVDIQPLKEQIESYNIKKRKAIDLMIDGLISKEDLKKQTEFYDDEILKLTEEITKSQDTNATHKHQLDSIRSYINDVKKTADSDSNSKEVYGELLKKVIVHEKGRADFYLNCVPFGFEIKYHIRRFNKLRFYEAIVDSCEII